MPLPGVPSMLQGAEVRGRGAGVTRTIRGYPWGVSPLLPCAVTLITAWLGCPVIVPIFH